MTFSTLAHTRSKTSNLPQLWITMPA